MAMPAMPVGKAERAGEQGRVRLAKLREQAEGGAGRRGGGKGRESRSIAVEPEEQGGPADRLPDQPAIRVKRRHAIGPGQLASIVPGCQPCQSLRLRAQ